MLIHLPIVENRIAQFAARFELHGTGWVYHGDRATGGLPVSDAERTALIAEHERLVRRAARTMWLWLPVAVILCLAYEIHVASPEPTPTWHFAPVMLLPMPWLAWEWRRADRLAEDLAGRRFAIAPPRTRWQGARSRLAALPPSIGVMLLLLSAALAVQSRPWATGTQRLWLAQAIAGMLGAGTLLWIGRRKPPNP